MTALIRVSVLKERDEAITAFLAKELSERLSTNHAKALVFAIPSPTTQQMARLRADCQGAGQAVYEATGKTPALELVGYGSDGLGKTVWRFAPRPRSPISESAL